MTCEQCDESSTFTEFHGKIGICDFYKNSTYVGEVDNCELYNDDPTKTCKTCENNYVLSDLNVGTCIFHTECNQGIRKEELDIDNSMYFVKYQD